MNKKCHTNKCQMKENLVNTSIRNHATLPGTALLVQQPSMQCPWIGVVVWTKTPKKDT